MGGFYVHLNVIVITYRLFHKLIVLKELINVPTYLTTLISGNILFLLYILVLVLLIMNTVIIIVPIMIITATIVIAMGIKPCGLALVKPSVFKKHFTKCYYSEHYLFPGALG